MATIGRYLGLPRLEYPEMMVWNPRSADAGSRPVTITVPTRAALMRDVRSALAGGRGISLATLNLDHVVKLRRDSAFAEAYARHSHVSADGRPVAWLAQLAGQQTELVAGADLLDPLMALAAETGAPVALVGSTAPVLDRAANQLCARHEGLNIAAQIAPSMGFDPVGAEGDSVLDEIAASGARIVILALGAPRQEILAMRGMERFPDVSFFSLGAAVDFVAGAQRRAPGWMRALALEWLWRLGSNPARLARRYGACAWLLPGLTVAALGSRAGTRAGEGETP